MTRQHTRRVWKQAASVVLLCLCCALGCTTSPEGTQLRALDGTWQITELRASGPRGDLSTVLRSRYATPPTLTVESESRPARYVLAGTRTESEAPTLRIEGQIEETGSATIAFVSGFASPIVWRLDVQTGTRAQLTSGPGPQGPAPLLRTLLPSIAWGDTEGARLQIERTD
jgi:hypothetical protein